jgi:LysR family transcriptional activator of nhaA
MRHLNYNHMLYFWTVAREGSVARAAESLHLTPQTVSGQIKRLEESVGAALFQRDGRALVLTDTGKLVAQFADEIFTLGHELAQVLRQGARPRTTRSLAIGVVNSIPKLITCELIAPAMALEEPVRVITHEATLEELLADLAVHRLDLVLSDRPSPGELDLRAKSRPLGDSRVAFFAAPSLARELSGEFPKNLDGAPILMPAARNQLRVRLDDWLSELDLHPQIVAEIDDSGLMKAFGQSGLGVFPAPASIGARICASYGVELVGETDAVRERFYAIVPDRKVVHPGVAKIAESGRQHLEPAA